MFQTGEKLDLQMLRDPNQKNDFKILFFETIYTYRLSIDEIETYQNFLFDRISEVE